MRAILRATAPLLFLTAACDDAPRALGPAESLAGDAAVFAEANPAGKIEGIEDLVGAQAAAWTDKDAAAYAATYTEDVQFINPIGTVLHGRTAVQAGHTFLFNPVNGPFRASSSSWVMRDVAFLSGTVALVSLDVTLTGFSALPPGLPAVEPGVVRTRVTWIAVRQQDGWAILFQQMTPLPAV